MSLALISLCDRSHECLQGLLGIVYGGTPLLLLPIYLGGTLKKSTLLHKNLDLKIGGK